MSSRTKALIAIVIASLFWSTAGLSKIIVQTFDPFFAGFLRFFVASIVILPFFLREKQKSPHIVGDLLPIALASTGNIIFYFLGLQTSTANTAALIYAGVPLVTSIIAHFAIHEHLSVKKLIGILIGIIGVFYITFSPSIEQGGIHSDSLMGNLFFVIAITIWSSYIVGSRHVMSTKGYSPITIAGFSIFISTIILFFLSLFSFKTSYISLLFQPNIILTVVHLGTFVTVVALTLYQWAIKHSSATTASLNNYIMPFFAVIVNGFILKEVITPSLVVGGVIIMISIVVLSDPFRRS